MAIFTAAELAEQIATYKAALLSLATTKSVTIAGNTYTKQDLPEIRKTLDWLEGQLYRLNGNPGPLLTPMRPAR